MSSESSTLAMNFQKFLLVVIAFVFKNSHGKLLSRMLSSVMSKLLAAALDLAFRHLSKTEARNLTSFGATEPKLCLFGHI